MDHVADKVCAIVERHDGRPSTRFKDLIDLVAISQRVSTAAEPQMVALIKEADRRAPTLPRSFVVPDRGFWVEGYRSEARRTVGLEAIELDEAVRIVEPFLNPLLSRSARGNWNPQTQRWASPDTPE